MILFIEKGTNNPILRQKAESVKQITAEIKQLALDIKETLEAHLNGAGLAAPQVGQLLRIIAVKPYPEQKTLILINPEIKKKSWSKETMVEGCLSLPETALPIKRAKKITVEALDIDSQPIKIEAKDFLARIIQHEIDHLQGILIVDKK